MKSSLDSSHLNNIYERLDKILRVSHSMEQVGSDLHRELEIIQSDKLSDGIDLYEKEFSKRFRKHYLSCALARLILQSPFMTKRLLRVASNDQDTIDFVVELLFDEAYLTLKEVFKIAYKFIIPTKLLVLSSKN